MNMRESETGVTILSDKEIQDTEASYDVQFSLNADNLLARSIKKKKVKDTEALYRIHSAINAAILCEGFIERPTSPL